MSPTLVIMAAGAGSRYGGLKQLAPIGPSGETLLEYAAYDALRAGFARAVLVVRPETEDEFRARLDAEMGGRMPVVYVHQAVPPGRAKPWGTGQAVLAADPEIEGTFAVVNADDFYGAESFAALAAFLRETRQTSPPTWALVGFEVARTLSDAGPVSRALCRLDGEGLLRDLVEIGEIRRRGGRIPYRDREGAERSLRGDELVSMNMWGFTPEVLPELRRRFEDFLARSDLADDAEFLLPDAVRSLVREERARVEVLSGAGRWCGITFREDREGTAAIISDLIARRRYPQKLWA